MIVFEVNDEQKILGETMLTMKRKLKLLEARYKVAHSEFWDSVYDSNPETYMKHKNGVFCHKANTVTMIEPNETYSDDEEI